MDVKESCTATLIDNEKSIINDNVSEELNHKNNKDDLSHHRNVMVPSLAFSVENDLAMTHELDVPCEDTNLTRNIGIDRSALIKQIGLEDIDGIVSPNDELDVLNSIINSNNGQNVIDDVDTLLSKFNDTGDSMINNVDHSNQLKITQNNNSMDENIVINVMHNNGKKNYSENVELVILQKNILHSEKENNFGEVNQKSETNVNVDLNSTQQSSNELNEKYHDLKLTLDVGKSGNEFISSNVELHNTTIKTAEVVASTISNKTQHSPILDVDVDFILNTVISSENENLNTIDSHACNDTPAFSKHMSISMDKKGVEDSGVIEISLEEKSIIEKAKEDLPTDHVRQVIDNKNDDIMVKDVNLDNKKQCETEDSDDDVIFFLDPTESKMETCETEIQDLDVKSIVEHCDINGEDKSVIEQNEKSKDGFTGFKDNTDDDVVLLLDDEDENLDSKKCESHLIQLNTNALQSNTSNLESCKGINLAINNEFDITKRKSTLEPDNSDNARDIFMNDKLSMMNINNNEVVETNSTCSNSSNLLQVAKPIEGSSKEDIENFEEDYNYENVDADGEEDMEDILNSEAIRGNESNVNDDTSPVSKRARYNRDYVSKNSEVLNTKGTTTKLQFLTDNIEETKNNCPNDSIDIQSDNIQKSSNDLIDKSELLAEIVPSKTSIPLYPPPNFDNFKGDDYNFKFDFMRRFRKSIHSMTRMDLEELVLQKIVEAIIHKSEFKELLEMVDKQEKIIASHRNKIAELSKQYRDLDMVHNRVLKDIETRNSQFIMPVKVTRAVGLQVYIPNKKVLSDTAISSTQNSKDQPNIRAAQITQNVISSGHNADKISLISNTGNGNSSGVMTRFASSHSSVPPSVVTSNSGFNSRKGCVQKITPIRPMPNFSNNLATQITHVTNSSSPYRNTTTQVSTLASLIQSSPRPFSKNVNTIPLMATTQRPPYSTSVSLSQQLRQQNQYHQQVHQQQQPLRQQQSNPLAIGGQRLETGLQLKQSLLCPTQRRVLMPSPVQSNTSLEKYITSISQLTGSSLSITAAKPKDKTVIDLTDEDEINSIASPSKILTTTGQSNNMMHRKVLSTQMMHNTNSAQMSNGRVIAPTARIPPVQSVINRSRTVNSTQALYGTNITRINAVQVQPVNQQRSRNIYPPPLPDPPCHELNPAWKSPPPRPIIRISNPENGIVISWSMEEPLDNHEECVSYQIFAYQQTNSPPSSDMWRHVGDVKAMLLPMAVTLTQFQEGQRYFFAVRAVDCHKRYGPFSTPKTWN